MPKYGKGRDLARQFSWQTRVGLGPKFGTVSINYYQIEQCDVIDEITDRCTTATGLNPRETTFDVETQGALLRCRPEGQRRFSSIGTVSEIRTAAQLRDRARQRSYAAARAKEDAPHGGGGAKAKGHRSLRRWPA